MIRLYFSASFAYTSGDYGIAIFQTHEKNVKANKIVEDRL